MRDTDLMAYREAWKLECWARSRPSISSYHLTAWCEAFCGTIDLRDDDNWSPSSILRDRLDPHWASVGSKQASHPWEHEVSNIHIPFHLSKEQSAQFCSTHAGSWLREWYESDWVAIVCWQQRSYFFLEVHSLHVQRLAQCRACLFWGKCICLFWNNYYLLYCPVQSYILSFISTFTCLIDRLHAHLLWDLQARRSLSRAMAASCQAWPSVRIVDGRGKLRSKQLVRKLSSVDGPTFWSDCAQSTSKYISSDWIHYQTHLQRVIRWHPWTCRPNYWE